MCCWPAIGITSTCIVYASTQDARALNVITALAKLGFWSWAANCVILLLHTFHQLMLRCLTQADILYLRYRPGWQCWNRYLQQPSASCKTWLQCSRPQQGQFPEGITIRGLGRMHRTIEGGRLHPTIEGSRMHRMIEGGRLHHMIEGGRLHHMIEGGQLHFRWTANHSGPLTICKKMPEEVNFNSNYGLRKRTHQLHEQLESSLLYHRVNILPGQDTRVCAEVRTSMGHDWSNSLCNRNPASHSSTSCRHSSKGVGRNSLAWNWGYPLHRSNCRVVIKARGSRKKHWHLTQMTIVFVFRRDRNRMLSGSQCRPTNKGKVTVDNITWL